MVSIRTTMTIGDTVDFVALMVIVLLMVTVSNVILKASKAVESYLRGNYLFCDDDETGRRWNGYAIRATITFHAFWLCTAVLGAVQLVHPARPSIWPLLGGFIACYLLLTEMSMRIGSGLHARVVWRDSSHQDQ